MMFDWLRSFGFALIIIGLVYFVTSFSIAGDRPKKSWWVTILVSGGILVLLKEIIELIKALIDLIQVVIKLIWG